MYDIVNSCSIQVLSHTFPFPLFMFLYLKLRNQVFFDSLGAFMKSCVSFEFVRASQSKGMSSNWVLSEFGSLPTNERTESKENPCSAGGVSKHEFPVEAGAWNHRCEAVYRAIAEQPSNPNVSVVAERGLVSVKFIRHDIPPRVWQRFITTHNTFHAGSGINFR